MKRILALIIAAALLMSFAACKTNEPPAPEADPTEAAQAPTEAPAESPTEAPMEQPTEAPDTTPYWDQFEGDDDVLPRIYAGDNVFFVVNADGAVYGWGNNEYGQLPGREGNADKPVYIGSGLTPVLVGDTVFALDENSDLVAWGRNDRAQLGQGDTKPHEGVVKVLENVSELMCRSEEYYAVTADGELYAWSYSRLTEIDDADIAAMMTPQKIRDNVKHLTYNCMVTGDHELYVCYSIGEWTKLADEVDKVWSDGSCMAVCDPQGRLYALSMNGEKQLICDTYTYGDGTVGRRFMNVVVSDGVIWALTVEGELLKYTAAESDMADDNGEIGKVETVMTEVADFRTASLMDEDWGYEYKFALKNNGELWSWSNHYSEITGRDDYETIRTPKCVLENVVYYTCTGAQTYAVTADGSVWACGEAADRGFIHGGLGTGNEESSYKFIKLDLKDIRFVSSFLKTDYIDYDDGTDGVELYNRTFAVDYEGRIFAWGWNGDGLLGVGSEEAEVLSPMEVHFAK